ncbi:MAG: hypothetical protein KDK71_01960 [Chlamydiia bacterium]|nr:hypothetical protein [Chlamydiia bacterium]
MEQTSTTYTERFLSCAFEGYDKESLGIAEKVAKVALALLCVVGVGLIPLAVTLTMDAVSYFENCNIVVEHPKPANQGKEVDDLEDADSEEIDSKTEPVIVEPLKPANQWKQLSNVGVNAFHNANLAINKKNAYHLELIHGRQTDVNAQTIKDWIAKAKEDEQKLVFIPIVLDTFLGIGEPHFVVVTVDIETQQVEYFDPRGANPYWEFRSVQSFNGRLKALLNACKEAVGAQQVKYNSKQVQNDSVSCGYFGCEYMERRSTTGSLKEAIKESYNISEIRGKVDKIVEEEQQKADEQNNNQNYDLSKELEFEM